MQPQQAKAKDPETKQIENRLRLTLVLVSGGQQAFDCVFAKYLPDHLSCLDQLVNRKSFKELVLAEGNFDPNVIHKLYPKSKKEGRRIRIQTKDVDLLVLTRIYLLMIQHYERDIKEDQYVTESIIKLRNVRNDIVHSDDMRMSDDVFTHNWVIVENCLVNMGLDRDTVAFFKTKPLQTYDLNSSLDEMKKRNDELLKKFELLLSQMQNLKESIDSSENLTHHKNFAVLETGEAQEMVSTHESLELVNALAKSNLITNNKIGHINLFPRGNLIFTQGKRSQDEDDADIESKPLNKRKPPPN